MRRCDDLNREIEALQAGGFRLDVIWPADEPCAALLSKGSETVGIASRDGVERPNGSMPPFVAEAMFNPASDSSGEGRAGMLYRDLIPSRLGGSVIASHIRIETAGPVDDWVHYHRLALQLIVVRRGWVRVAYEGQGAPIVMEPGDLVFQPPGIRHRVLESSAGLEVVELSAPASHETFADHDLALPGAPCGTERRWERQAFLFHKAASTAWTPAFGGEIRETMLDEATDGLAQARIVRAIDGATIRFDPHDGDLVFGFVMEGRARLSAGDERPLGPADCFVIPPGDGWAIVDADAEFRLLHVTTRKFD